MFEYICRYLKINDVEYKKDFELRNISAVKIGGSAKIVSYPDAEDKIISLVRFLKEIGCRYRVLGRMSNVLPPDEEFCGVIIRTDRLDFVNVEGESIFVGAGVSLPRIARIFANLGLSGFEELAGIPGSSAGAVIGNAGAFGREISDVCASARCFMLDEETVEKISPQDMGFDYRTSNFKNANCLVLSSEFKGKCSFASDVFARMRLCKEKRCKSQPIDKPSLGSTFKKPSQEISAGELIDKCGLKGFAIGGAMISEKHAGFIVNTGNATAGDYISVADHAQKNVLEKFSIRLKKEIEILT